MSAKFANDLYQTFRSIKHRNSGVLSYLFFSTKDAEHAVRHGFHFKLAGVCINLRKEAAAPFDLRNKVFILYSGDRGRFSVSFPASAILIRIDLSF